MSRGGPSKTTAVVSRRCPVKRDFFPPLEFVVAVLFLGGTLEDIHVQYLGLVPRYGKGLGRPKVCFSSTRCTFFHFLFSFRIRLVFGIRGPIRSTWSRNAMVGRSHSGTARQNDRDVPPFEFRTNGKERRTVLSRSGLAAADMHLLYWEFARAWRDRLASFLADFSFLDARYKGIHGRLKYSWVVEKKRKKKSQGVFTSGYGGTLTHMVCIFEGVLGLILDEKAEEPAANQATSMHLLIEISM
ncbi:hypothetical protein VTK56DRAFT_10086 [Thermocarpiscus australiensis]